MANKPKLSYVMRKVKIDASNIDRFTADEEQRRLIRDGKVRSIAATLRAGNHFNSPWVTNVVGKNENIVDGNHRYEAIKLVLATDPTFSIDVWIAQHSDLSADEERAVFTAWNIGTKQTADDFLKIYWSSIPFGDEMLRKIPAAVYGHPSKVKIKTLAGAHIEAVKQRAFTGTYSAGANKTVADFQKLNRDDILTMRAFMADMSTVFGPYQSSYEFWKPTPIMAFYRIWYDNRTIPRDRFMKDMKRVFLSPSTIQTWKELAKTNGRNAVQMFYTQAIQQLNQRNASFQIAIVGRAAPDAEESETTEA